MEGFSLLAFILVGVVAGWIAGIITKGSGFGIIVDMVVGIVGAFIGNYVLAHFNVLPGGLIGLLISAVLGAVILITVVALIRKMVR